MLLGALAEVEEGAGRDLRASKSAQAAVGLPLAERTGPVQGAGCPGVSPIRHIIFG